jgi:hypothetical protein
LTAEDGEIHQRNPKTLASHDSGQLLLPKLESHQDWATAMPGVKVGVGQSVSDPVLFRNQAATARMERLGVCESLCDVLCCGRGHPTSSALQASTGLNFHSVSPRSRAFGTGMMSYLSVVRNY